MIWQLTDVLDKYEIVVQLMIYQTMWWICNVVIRNQVPLLILNWIQIGLINELVLGNSTVTILVLLKTHFLTGKFKLSKAQI